MKLFTIMEECPDYFYGFFITELFVKEETRDKRLKELKETNKGITYADGEIEVNEE